MAFLATVKDIKRQSGEILVVVLYHDEATLWENEDMFKYLDDGTVTQAAVVADITAKGQAYKAKLTQNNNLKSKIGTVITIE